MTPNLELFKEKLKDKLNPHLPAKELAETIVAAALESEYGRSLSSNAGFDKMVKTLADALVTNPELRRQSLAIASLFNKNDREQHQKDIPKRDQSVPVPR